MRLDSSLSGIVYYIIIKWLIVKNKLYCIDLLFMFFK